MHILDSNQKNIMDKWLENIDIIPINEDEKNFYNNLKENGYILESYADELEKKEVILKKLRMDYENEKSFTNCVTFLITYDCNFACPYCYEAANQHDSTTMTEDMVDKIFEIHNNKIEFITLFGGEPLLPKNKKIVNYIISKNPHSKFIIITNGYHLLEYNDIFKKIKQKIEFQITLDGSESCHDKSRILKNGSGTYKRIMENVDFCIEKGHYVKFRMNITYDNYSSCIKMKKSLIEIYENYLDLISFEMLPLLGYDNKEYTDLLSKIIEQDFDDSIITEHKKNKIITPNMPFIYSILNNAGLKSKYINCPAQTYNRVYDSEGNIYGCLLSVGNAKKTLGTYYSKYELFKENTYLHRNIETVEKCSQCINAFYCGGGCADAAVENFGNCMEPECGRFYHMIYELMPNILKHLIV